MALSDLIALLKSPRTVIVDVRTRDEFQYGHIPGSFNIPLEEIPGRMNEIRKMPSIVLCCADSGLRSEEVAHYLHQNGIQCINGGGWQYVNYLKNK